MIFFEEMFLSFAIKKKCYLTARKKGIVPRKESCGKKMNVFC